VIRVKGRQEQEAGHLLQDTTVIVRTMIDLGTVTERAGAETGQDHVKEETLPQREAETKEKEHLIGNKGYTF